MMSLMIRNFVLTLIIFSIIHLPLNADQIELKNGSKIIGKLIGSKDNQYLFATDFAGTLNIDFSMVTSISTDNPLNFALKSGNQFKGKLNSAGGSTQIQSMVGNIDISNDKVLAIWPEGQDNPLISKPQPRKWQLDLGIDIGGKTGDTEKFSTAESVKATLRSDVDRFIIYGRGAKATENGVKTVEEYIGGMDYENNFTELNSWYARTELEADDIENLDLRTTVATGYGRYFIKKEKHEFRGRTGLQYRHESFINGVTNDSPGLDLGLFHMIKNNKNGKLTTDITYTPSFENFSDYRVFHDTAYEVPLIGSDLWKLRMGILNEYNSEPVPGNEYMNTTYYTRLIMSWK